MNDIVNIIIEEINETVSLSVEQNSTDINIVVSEVTEQVVIEINEIGIKGEDGLDGIGAVEAQEIRDRLEVIEEETDGEVLGATPLDYYILARNN